MGQFVLLFCLSLVPFVIRWIGEYWFYLIADIAAYGAVLAMVLEHRSPGASRP